MGFALLPYVDNEGLFPFFEHFLELFGEDKAYNGGDFYITTAGNGVSQIHFLEVLFYEFHAHGFENFRNPFGGKYEQKELKKPAVVKEIDNAVGWYKILPTFGGTVATYTIEGLYNLFGVLW